MDLNELLDGLYYFSEPNSCKNCKFKIKKCANADISYCRTLLLCAFEQLDDQDRIKQIIKGCMIDKNMRCSHCEIQKESVSCIRYMAAKAYERISLCMIN